MSQRIELAVALSARPAEQGARQAENAFQRVARRGEEVVQSAQRIDVSWRSLVRTAGTLAGAFGVVFGAREVVRFARDSVAASNELDQTQAQLINTLDRLGIAWETNRHYIQAHSDALWETHRLTGGEVMDSLHDLMVLTQDYETSLRAVGIVADISADLELDRSRAARYLARAIDGNVSSFGRYNIQLDESGDILEQLEARFSGAAAASVTGNEAMRKAFGDLREEVGATMRVIGAGITDTQDLADAIRELSTWTRENRTDMAAWGAVIVETVKRVGGILWDLVNVAFEVGRAVGFGLENILSVFAATVVDNANVVIRTLEGIRQRADQIPGINLDFQINELPSDVFWENAERTAESFWESVGNMGTSLGSGAEGIAGLFGDWELDIGNAEREAGKLGATMGEVDDPDLDGHVRRTALLARAVDLGVATVREQVELMALERELLDIMQDQNRSMEDRVQAAQEYRAAMEAVQGMVDLPGVVGDTGPRSPGAGIGPVSSMAGPFSSREDAEAARRSLEGVEEALGLIARRGEEIQATTEGVVAVADAMGWLDGESRSAARGIIDVVRGLQQMSSASSLAGQIGGGMGVMGGIIGIGAGLLGGLFGSGDRDRRREEERREQERLAMEAERAADSLERFVESLRDVSRFEGMRGDLEEEVRSAFLAEAATMGGDALMENVQQALDQEGMEAVLERWKQAGPAFQELARQWEEGLERIEEQRLAEVSAMEDQNDVMILRLQGHDAEADALEEEHRHKERLAKARELESDELVEQAEAIWELKQARRAEREAAELAQLLFDQRQDQLSLEAREAALIGNERARLHAQEQRRAEAEIRQAWELYDAGKRSEEWYRRMVAVIEGEVNQALREFERQARAAAEAERFRQQQDLRSLQVELLREQGREAQARSLQNQIDLDRALNDGRSDQYITTLQLLQAERDRNEALRQSETAMKDTTAAMNQMGRVMDAPTGLRLSLQRHHAQMAGSGLPGDPFGAGGMGATVNRIAQHSSVDQSTTIQGDIVVQMPRDASERDYEQIISWAQKKKRAGGQNPFLLAGA